VTLAVNPVISMQKNVLNVILIKVFIIHIILSVSSQRIVLLKPIQMTLWLNVTLVILIVKPVLGPSKKIAIFVELVIIAKKKIIYLLNNFKK
jgi:hypothetical protein